MQKIKQNIKMLISEDNYDVKYEENVCGINPTFRSLSKNYFYILYYCGFTISISKHELHAYDSIKYISYQFLLNEYKINLTDDDIIEIFNILDKKHNGNSDNIKTQIEYFNDLFE